MKIQRVKKKTNKMAYLPILIIMLSLTIITASSFAFFTDRGGDTGTVSFGKVELSDGTNASITKTLYDVLPGDAIIDETLSFSKSVDSEPIYVRAKLSFSSQSTDETVAEFLTTLRAFSAADFGISSTEIGTTGAKWSAKDGNYVYLVNADDETTLFDVTDTTTFSLSNSIVVPDGLEQAVDGEGQATFGQYMEDIKFHFAFQAIQSESVDETVEVTKNLFDTIFSENAYEVIPFIASYDMGMSSSPQEIDDITNAQSQITLPALPENSTAPMGLVYEGTEQWYWRSNGSGEFFDGEETLTLSANDSFKAIWGAVVTSDDFYYNLVDDNIEIYALISEIPNNIIIPQTLSVSDNDYTVSSIGATFNTCSNLESLVIADSVSSIGDSAFYECKSLKKLILSASLTTIPSYSFYSCIKLEKLIIPNAVTSIGNAAFSWCSSLMELTIPSSVTDIGEGGSGVFDACRKLVHIENLSSVSITTNSFSLPTIIAQEIRSDSNFFSTITYDENGNILFNVGETVYYLGYTGNSTSVTIPIGVTEIYSNAFYFNEVISEVTISSGVTSINSYSFSDCYSLSYISIPASVTNIGPWAIQECHKLVHIVNLSGIYSLGLTPIIGREIRTDNEFVNVLNEDINGNIIFTINDETSEYYENVYYFGYNGSETSLTLSSEIIGIYPYAFISNTQLQSITLPASVETIGGHAFYRCKNLTSVSLSEGLLTLGDSAFGLCHNLSTISIPTTINSIGECAFYECFALSHIAIPNITTMGYGIFISCNLLEIVIPDSVLTIGDWVFASNGSAAYVVLSNNVTSIGSSSFDNCNNLTKLYYKGTSSEWDSLSAHIESGNLNLTNATRYYFTEKGASETAFGSWWYYDGDTIIELVI